MAFILLSALVISLKAQCSVISESNDAKYVLVTLASGLNHSSAQDFCSTCFNSRLGSLESTSDDTQFDTLFANVSFSLFKKTLQTAYSILVCV